jgi:uncharacterized protein (TIGR02996 family)
VAEDVEHTKASFFAMIRADPDNENNRLIFADWCEEHSLGDLAAMLRGGSRAWLEDFARQIDISYADLMGHAMSSVKDKDYSVLIDHDDQGFGATNLYWDNEEKFWEHFAVMTGIFHNSDFFRCCY